MTTTHRKQTPAQARKSALDSDFAPLYAVAGLTEAFAATVRGTLASTQERAAERVSQLQRKPGQLEQQAKLSADDISQLIRSFPEQVKALPERTKTRLTEVQKRAQSYLAEATNTYAELAGRGKLVVDETIVSARKLSGKAERKAGDVFSEVADAVDPAFERVQETVTVARKTVTGRSATETVTPRGAARAAASRRVAAEKDAAEKAADDKIAAERSAARSAAAKRGAAKRAAAKKAASSPA